MSIKHIVQVLLVAAMLVSSTTQAQPPDWVDPPGLDHAKEVQERHTPALMARDGIEGTGIGYDDNGEVAIKVYTARAGVPGIPQAIEGVPVQVEVTGMFVARADPTARFDRPVPIGVSTGHPEITAGTIGCRVKGSSGNVYALSNNHVYANGNDANNGDNVLQPGPYDGGQDPADAIGTLHDFEPINFNGSNNYIDAAIAHSSISELGYATPSGAGYGTPSTTMATPSLGLDVQKYGRTTGWTHGEVSEINVTVDVCYQTRGPIRCVKLARFVDQIAITPGTFSDGGDSGSLIVTDDGNNDPVGLLFAGSSTRTLANRIDLVLNRFNVTIDDSSGGSGPTNVPPEASFTYTTNELTAYFTDESTDSDGSVVSWSWDFGDENTSTAQNPSHTYAACDTYPVTLRVTDDGGATGTTEQDVTVLSSTGNSPPTADFSYTTSELNANFTDLSTDSDGTVVSWSWDFGDGNSSTAQNPSHTYAAAGTYTVSLTVTDSCGATGSEDQTFTVSEPVAGDITLSATGYKDRGWQKADLEWSGAASASVNVYREGSVITTTSNDTDTVNYYTDEINLRGGGSYTYQVCEVTDDGVVGACSNEATVTF